MSAPLGNKFWELRSTHGRDNLFASPELMWEAACDYFEWCDGNPFMESEAKVVSNGNGEGSSVEIVEVPRMRPYTLHGLCLYLDCTTNYFKEFKKQGRSKIEDFMPVIEKIEEVIYNQKFSGAASGFLNANIISRDLGLIDKKEVEASNIFKVTIQDDGDTASPAKEDNQ